MCKIPTNPWEREKKWIAEALRIKEHSPGISTIIAKLALFYMQEYKLIPMKFALTSVSD